jgi:hypothetical protein
VNPICAWCEKELAVDQWRHAEWIPLLGKNIYFCTRSEAHAFFDAVDRRYVQRTEPILPRQDATSPRLRRRST